MKVVKRSLLVTSIIILFGVFYNLLPEPPLPSQPITQLVVRKSMFHKNLGMSYPNHADAEEAKALAKDPGDEIKIHELRKGAGFLGKFHRLFNWTAGCIAVTDA